MTMTLTTGVGVTSSTAISVGSVISLRGNWSSSLKDWEKPLRISSKRGDQVRTEYRRLEQEFIGAPRSKHRLRMSYLGKSPQRHTTQAAAGSGMRAIFPKPDVSHEVHFRNRR